MHGCLDLAPTRFCIDLVQHMLELFILRRVLTDRVLYLQH